MCGIVGIVDRHGESPKLIQAMTNTLIHRGPDDEGYLVFNTESRVLKHLIGDHSKVPGEHVSSITNKFQVLLGHRRLSIIDVSPSGHQPMATEDQMLWIVFNGEIYNYREIRNELIELGYNFRTNSDTEVLLKAYRQYGFDCVEKFNGMWAFAILDLERNLVFLSRDLPGVKPLYLVFDEGNRLMFASEAKALISVAATSFTIDDEKVFTYLVFGSVDYDERTFFKEIQELPPGHNLLIDLSSYRVKKWRYRTIAPRIDYERFSEERLSYFATGLRERLFNAVALRLRADVMVGSCLSGGVDSSAIVMTVNELMKGSPMSQLGERQKVFTVSFKGSRVDETHWAENIARVGKIEWYTVSPTFEELIDELDDLVYYQDFPFPSTSIYAQYRVMKLASEHGVKVTLDGQGGDEIFGGYIVYYSPYFLELLRNFDILQVCEELKNSRNSPITRKRLLSYLSFSLLRRLLPRLSDKLILWKLPYTNLLKRDFLAQFSEIPDQLVGKFAISKGLNAVLLETYERTNLPSLLRFADRNSMRFSIESRVPFADDSELVKFAFSIPSTYKIHGGFSKYVLRVALDGIVPRENLWRVDKIGFETPEDEWMSAKRDKLKATLLEVSPRVSDFVNVEKTLSCLSDQKRIRKETSGRFIWRLLILGRWIEIIKTRFSKS